MESIINKALRLDKQEVKRRWRRWRRRSIRVWETDFFFKKKGNSL